MHDAVRSNWLRFNEPLEGRVPHMYLDVKGWVSTGLGNKIDETAKELSPPTEQERAESLTQANRLEWTVAADGSPATADQVAADWDAVKSRLDQASQGPLPFGPPVTQLQISEEEMDRFVFSELDRMERYLVGRAEFTEFESWPASSQLATLSMSWAMGPAFAFPNFQRHAAAGDWAAAATECHFKPDVGTIRYRNKLDRMHFECAATAAARGLSTNSLAITLGEVLGVQHALWMLGINPGPQDGGDGGMTREGVSAYQSSRGLAVNGVWNDPDTQAQLTAELGAGGWNVV